MNLNYFMPTKIISGQNCIIKNADTLNSFGRKALIVCGKNSAKANGSLDDVLSALNRNKQEFCIFDKIMPNPTIPCVYEGANFAKENSINFIIAIGGGSPMDAAKAIALLAVQDIKEDDLFNTTAFSNEILPLVFVPTTAGTGSEVTQYSILTNQKLETKTSISTPLIFPKLAFLDGKYMVTLGIKTTINTAIDALSHSIEGILSKRSNVVSDALAFKC